MKQTVAVIFLIMIGVMLRNYSEQRRQYQQNRALAQAIAEAINGR